MTPRLIAAVVQHNRSAKMATYAFLDAAWAGSNGIPTWDAGAVLTGQYGNISRPVLRELRRYNLREDSIREPWHIDARYGAFFGCGDAALLRRVVALAQHEPTHPLHDVAAWSLGSCCKQYPHVAAAVRQEGGEA